MHYHRLGRWLTIAWLFVAGAVTLIAAFGESHYLAKIRTYSALESEPTSTELYESWQTAGRVKNAALAVFICGMPVWLLSCIYGGKKRKSAAERIESPD